MNILFLTNLLPFPLDNGGKIKTYTTLKALAEAGHYIDLVCFNESECIDEENELELKKLCRQVEQVQLKLTTSNHMGYMIKVAFKSLFSQYSFGVYKYRSEEMYRLLDRLLKENTYEYIYYAYLHLCIYQPYIVKRSPKSNEILDEQNCESIIMQRYARNTKNLAKRLFLKLEAHKLKKFEINAINKVDKCIVLSEEDYRELEAMNGKAFEHQVIPIGVTDKGIKHERIRQDEVVNILFVGTLTWEPNNHGLIWFLKKVMPNLPEGKYRLYIVGKNPSKEVLSLAKGYKNVVITGYVEDVDPYYDLCDLMVVPLFFGSGQRVKIIEAFSKGMPTISTSIGAEGLSAVNRENIMLADTEEAFVDGIKEMEDKRMQEKLSANGRTLYEERFSPEVIKKMILEYLNTESTF